MASTIFLLFTQVCGVWWPVFLLWKGVKLDTCVSIRSLINFCF